MSDKRFNNENLKNAIDKSGMTREQIAAKVGCDTSSITKYYNGDRYPKTDIIIKLAELFNISTDYLLGVTKIETALKTDDNTALRISCDYTGLDEKILRLLNLRISEYRLMLNDEQVKRILNECSTNEEKEKILNQLEHPSYPTFTNELVGWMLCTNFRNILVCSERIKDYFSDVDIEHLKFKNTDKALKYKTDSIDFKNMLNGSLFEIQNSFIDFIKKYIDYYYILNTLNDLEIKSHNYIAEIVNKNIEKLTSDKGINNEQ